LEVSDFNEAIKRKPTEAFGAFVGRGDTYFALGQQDTALGQLAQQRSSGGATAGGPSQSRRVAQEFNQAVRDYDSAIKMKPNIAFVFQKKEFVYFVMGDDYRAIENYARAIALNPNNSYYFDLRGEAYEREGLYKRAVQDYDEAIWLNPKDGVAYGNRGFLRKLFTGDPAGGDADLARMEQLK
jgi:tetratricopeptide (TPR) repeat protein